MLLWLDEIDFEVGLSLMEAIAQHPHNIPIVVVTDSHDFQQRLQIVQHGADMLLPTASPPWHMVEVVTQTLRADREDFKVVVVDDDVQVLALVQTVLSPWGMQTTTVDHPSQLWSTLEEVQPQILVLDVEMPEANGLELCQVLRADERWQHLPVLFLTVHEDANTQHQAFSVGADDFVSKSTMTADLPSRILNRLQRLVKI
ncbi:MAG: response regulator [Elainellaceae cyanobacterium]